MLDAYNITTYWQELLHIWPMAILIFCVLSTIYMGVAAPTESAGLSPLGVTILIYIVYLTLGYFLNGSAMLLMTLPFTYLLMIGVGHDPLWFGVMYDTRHSSDHNNNISPYMYLITYDDEVITFEEKRR